MYLRCECWLESKETHKRRNSKWKGKRKNILRKLNYQYSDSKLAQIGRQYFFLPLQGFEGARFDSSDHSPYTLPFPLQIIKLQFLLFFSWKGVKWKIKGKKNDNFISNASFFTSLPQITFLRSFRISL